MRLLGKLTATVFVCVCVLDLWAQPAPDTLWTKRYGFLNWDVGSEILQTSDGGFIAAGYCSGPYQDMYIVKTSALGETLWTRIFGGPYDDNALALCGASDGGCVVAGYTRNSDQMGAQSFVYLVRLDSAGDTLWTRTFGRNQWDGASDIYPTSDGGFIITGWTSISWLYQMSLIKLDSEGFVEWSKIYESPYGSEAESLCLTSDGGYILAGESIAFDHQTLNGYVVKTDEQGDTLWTRTYGMTGNTLLHAVRQTSDEGYIIVGGTSISGQQRMYFIKLDENGDTLWTKVFASNFYEAHSIELMVNGHYLVVGDALGQSDSQDVALIKTDSSGNIVWTGSYGGPYGDSGYDLSLTQDGGAVLTGYYGVRETFDLDLYVIRLSSVMSPVNQPISLTPVAFRLSIFPNPFNASATLNYSLSRTGPTELVIYNLLGEHTVTLVNGLREAGTHSVIWNAENYPSGIYFARLKVSETMQTMRVVLAK